MDGHGGSSVGDDNLPLLLHRRHLQRSSILIEQEERGNLLFPTGVNVRTVGRPAR